MDVELVPRRKTFEELMYHRLLQIDADPRYDDGLIYEVAFEEIYEDRPTRTDWWANEPRVTPTAKAVLKAHHNR
jgi:hypothetical protein